MLVYSQITLYLIWFALDLAYDSLFHLLIDLQRSKLIGVPKDSRGPRLINEEPVINQWYQQGIMGWTVDRLESHKLSSGSVNFTDQSVNRSLALEASNTRDLATIDLKEASDRVSLALVKRLYVHSPEYLSAIMACRTECAIIPYSEGNVTHLLRKFAAMGSALCFTTLAWTIYSLVHSALALRGWDNQMILDSVHVYGDDLIVPKCCFDLVCHTLEKYGLLINRDKSFVGSQFAESCGMDAFNGSCVTPVRVRKLIPRGNFSTREVKSCLKDPAMAEAIVKTVKLANTMYLKGFWKSSEYLYSYTESVLGRKLPFGSTESPYLCRLAEDTDVRFLNRSLLKPVVHNLGTLVYYRERTSFSALVMTPVKKFTGETGKDRLRRVLPALGNHNKLPEIGEFPDRGVTLSYRRIALDPRAKPAYDLRDLTGSLAHSYSAKL